MRRRSHIPGQERRTIMHQDAFFIHPDLLYFIPAGEHAPERLRNALAARPEIRFVSLAGIDLAGNDTDEKIPVSLFLQDIEGYLSGGVQTDGSSVVLPSIATLNNGKVDLIADSTVTWFVDYNYENIDPRSGLPVGTLRIPSFLKHNGEFVCSRSLLKRAVTAFDEGVRDLLDRYPAVCGRMGFSADDVQEVTLTAATELEFWVRTPEDKVNREKLSVSQGLQEQYWKRTKGVVRTALEHAIELLERYGLSPEMGHKEVGGVKAQVMGSGDLGHIMEQLEIDWRFSTALQTADNELFARIFIKEVFRMHGLEATFMAKPVDGVAGSGEHIHINAMARLRNGKKVNLFSPADYGRDFLSIIGWGSLMGFMKHYDSISPFITVSNDAFNRLQPGFEAPTHAVASIGADIHSPSRNRTVLLGLIRSMESPMSTRFEVRSPNPHTNVYICLAAAYPFLLDGIAYAVSSGCDEQALQAEFCKEAGSAAVYLPVDRMFRSELDVFEHYADEERDRLFGKPPATVYQTIRRLLEREDGLEILYQCGVFSETVILSYTNAMLNQWIRELKDRLLEDNLEHVRACRRFESTFDCDDEAWDAVDTLRNKLAKDRPPVECMFTRIRKAIDRKDLRTVSELQLEMAAMIHKLDELYLAYTRNHLDI